MHAQADSARARREEIDDFEASFARRAVDDREVEQPIESEG